MYLCLCNGLREKEICAAIAQGVSCADEVYCKLGCRPVCGKCVPYVEDVLMDIVVGASPVPTAI